MRTAGFIVCLLGQSLLAAELSSVPAGQGRVTLARQSGATGRATNAQGLSVSSVSVNAQSFNPSKAGKVTLQYQLSRDARVTVKVFDPDRRLVRTLADAAARRAGVPSEVWDGRDLDGRVVPNESYFFTIEATDSTGAQIVYDPITFSGGEFADVTQGALNRDSGTLTYMLSQPSRVLLRAGMATGLLLKTVVDWEPRPSGAINEYWDGKDADGLFDVPTMKGTTMVLTYMTLPATSVIAFGNDSLSYRTYSSSFAQKRPLKTERPMTGGRRISPHFLKNRATDRSFKVNIVFPDLDKGGGTASIPTIKDGALFRLAVADQDQDVLAGQQYELMMHVNTLFLVEEERGYLPFTSQLEVKALPAGEHIFTVNIITFGDQIGVGSRKIRVVK